MTLKTEERVREAQEAAARAKGEADAQSVMLAITEAHDEPLYTDIFEDAELTAEAQLPHDYGIGELVDIVNGYW